MPINDWYGEEAPEEIIEAVDGGSAKVSSLETFENSTGDNVLSVNQLISSNFDGSFAVDIDATKAINLLLVGEYLYLDSANEPLSSTSGLENYAAYLVDSVTTDSGTTTVKVILDSSTYDIIKSSSTTVAYRGLDALNPGNSGWAISSDGDAVFNNIVARGTIEATAGKFGDWSVGSYQSYDGLYYSLNSGGEILESAVTPTNLYLKTDSTIFGSNFSWSINSIADGDGYMAVLKNLDNSSSPFDEQPIFYVRDTGSLYSIYGTFEESLTSYGNFYLSANSSSSPTLDASTNFSNNNVIYATQYNTGQTSTIVRLDAARTSSLSSNFFIRAFSAVGTASDEEFQVQLNGVVRGDGAYSSPTADYAEFFEWQDGNPNEEDRVGYSVSLIGNKIKIAESGEVPIGIISAIPSVTGDSPWNGWKDKYLKDEFGRELYEPCTIYQWEENKKLVNCFSDRIPEGIIVPQDKEIISSERKVLNPDFNEELEYTLRDDRPEWDTVGLLGKIRLRKGQMVAPTWIKLRDISENVEEWLVK